MIDFADPDRFREAMRLTASGVAVVSTEGPAGPAGLTVSSLCSLSMEPPALIFCVNRSGRALRPLLENGVFAANFLHVEQTDLADAFAGRAPHLSDDRFSLGRWRTMVTGAPVLCDALCAFDCRVSRTFDVSTHCIVVGDVLAVASTLSEPLVFSDRRYRSLAAT